MYDDYLDYTPRRLSQVLKIAWFRRGRLTHWQREKIAEFKAAKKPLTEQQRFFLKNIEEKLIINGWLT